MSAGNFVTVSLAGQDFCVPAAQVRDVLRAQPLTPVPRAPHAVAGLLNLRGRVVTAVDMRARIGLPPRAPREAAANVVVEHEGELYALIVDAAGEVCPLDEGAAERVPATLDPLWREVAAAIHLGDSRPLIILDIARALDLGSRPHNLRVNPP